MGIVRVILDYRDAYIAGLYVTLKLCGIAWVGGLVCGSAVALAAEWLPRLVAWPVAVFSRITEAIPILVLLFWLHYPVQSALGVVIDPFITTVALLTVLNTLAVFGILHAAILKVSVELVELARVSGVTRPRTFWRIKFPLALRSAIGSLTSSQVNVLQLSIFGSLISVGELFRTSQRINAQIYKPVEVYTGLAVFFLIVCLPLNLIGRHFDRRLA
jgi:His/Glu/Gln/Arg/opine family amino acid ABC transporter permease subunit